MRRLLLIVSLVSIAGAIVDASSQGSRYPRARQRRNPGDVIDTRNPVVEREPRTRRSCPDTPRRIVDIKTADPNINKAHHDLMRRRLIESVGVANTTIRLGPTVVLDFTDATADELPLSFGPCVTLTSVSAFRPDTNSPHARRPGVVPQIGTNGGMSERPASLPVVSVPRSAKQSVHNAQRNLGDVTGFLEPPPARSPSSPGPLLKFGPRRNDGETVFLEIRSIEGHQPNDGVRISGLRIQGPSLGQQETDEIGILAWRSLNIEISNIEIFGWGGSAIEVRDHEGNGPGQESPSNRPGDRIGRPSQVRIFNNFIHHNQHPREGLIFERHAAGYGVKVNDGAWAEIVENVFDFNRHAIAASGKSGGYEARRNLVLKGGGHHFAGFHTHQFDIHGSGNNGSGGQAGVQFWYSHNAFQYQKGAAIEIRGRPHLRVDIHDNVFPHEGLENDLGDDAIHVRDRDDLDVIRLGAGNIIDFDSYGKYGVGDFDGDGIDDLFLATGQTWWYSSLGEFQWSYLSTRTERLNQVRLGYFDDDLRCDVLTESGGQWLISSGGTGPWRSIGAFGAPLSEIAFGRFDPLIRDDRPGATRRTTHAFRRAPNGEWLVTSLSAPYWRPVQSSSIPMSKLRFGDFTGDGVTDVLAVENGRWAISESANSGWRRLNPHLSNDVSSLLFADLNNNNIDDILRLERTGSFGSGASGLVEERFTWWVSDDGRSRWRKLKTYTLTYPSSLLTTLPPRVGFAGRFGVAPGGGVLLIDHNRIGRFFSEAEAAAGAAPDWSSLFAF